MWPRSVVAGVRGTRAGLARSPTAAGCRAPGQPTINVQLILYRISVAHCSHLVVFGAVVAAAQQLDADGQAEVLVRQRLRVLRVWVYTGVDVRMNARACAGWLCMRLGRRTATTPARAHARPKHYVCVPRVRANRPPAANRPPNTIFLSPHQRASSPTNQATDLEVPFQPPAEARPLRHVVQLQGLRRDLHGWLVGWLASWLKVGWARRERQKRAGCRKGT
jgi:hypothetical protein